MNSEGKRPPERPHAFSAWFTFKGENYVKPFDDYFIAVEWCCIRLESIGARKEKFARAKVERGGAVVWEIPETPRRKDNPFGFAHFTVR